MKKSVSPRSLNKDDNKLSLGPDESTFSLNIDSEGLASDEAGIVKQARGNAPASFSDSSMAMPPGTNTIVGSVHDEQLNVVYFFVHNQNNNHSIVAFNSKTKTYRVVYQSSALDFHADSFVKADLVRLRRVPADTEMVIETPPDPESINPVRLKFRVEIDMSAAGELAGYKSYDSADSLNLFTGATLRVEGVGISFYENTGPIGEGANTVPSSVKMISLSKVDALVDGWVLSGVIDVLVHPDSLDNSSAIIKYNINNQFFGSADVSRNINSVALNQGAVQAELGFEYFLGRTCYGFVNKSIDDLLISDLYSGYELSAQNSISATGKLLDRKFTFVSNVDFSNSENWLNYAVSAINEYVDSPLSSGERSYPTSRMDNGGDPTTGPGGGGGGGGTEVVTITFCEDGSNPQAGFDNFSDALDAFYASQAAGYITYLEDVCPNAAPTPDFDPGVVVWDEMTDSWEFYPSSTVAAVDPVLYTFPHLYQTFADFYISSCGTMRRKTRFIFRLGQGVNGEPQFAESLGGGGVGLRMAVDDQNGVAGLDFSETISEMVSGSFQYNDPPAAQNGAREFEISFNINGGNVVQGATGLDVLARLASPEGSSASLSIANVCYFSNAACDDPTAGGLPSPDEVNGDDVRGDDVIPEVVNDGVVIISVTTSEDPEKPATQEDSTITPISEEVDPIIKAKTETKKK